MGICPQPGIPLKKRARDATVGKERVHVRTMALMAVRTRMKREVVSVAPGVEERAGCLSKGRATNTGSDWRAALPAARPRVDARRFH